MRLTFFRTIVAVFTFLFGFGLTLFWIFYPQIPDIPALDTNIGCNFADTSNCQVSDSQRNFLNQKILSKFEEKTLSEYQFTETYRFVLFPTFDAPLIVRIGRLNDNKILIAKKLSIKYGIGVENFGKLSYENRRELSDEEWNTAIDLLNEMSFWNTSPKSDEIPVEDATEWIIEGKNGNLFHEVRRITPDEKFRKLISHFLKIAEVEKEYEGY